MEHVALLPVSILTDGWIDSKYIPAGQDKYYLRNRQQTQAPDTWRPLFSHEIEKLVQNNNTAASWDSIYVTDDFDPMLLKNNKFYGLVRIGRVKPNALQFHDLRLPVGITNSSIHSCDIGNDCAIHDVHYLSHYIVSDRCMLFNIQEMSVTDHAKFGNGIVKDGEPESVRIALEVMNETGCRPVYPFDGMITADAYLCAKFIDNQPLQHRLRTMTQQRTDSRRGYYGTIGEGCVIKHSSILKDVKIGTDCYIKGASKLKNITINSSFDEPSQIGENVILVNGIVGYGCKIFYSCTAVRFILGNNCNLKYGARFINSFMGDNSTISCCEVLNSLIFPAHEQHHNNSFLVASVIEGQSNMAAGATVGSNHNSRTNDNEIVAGRGFWPGLCSSVKHSSRFACYTLLTKAAYPAELDIPLPFAMVNDNQHRNELQIMPAFWWLYNMYALARNSWKYSTRDKRKHKVQHIEFDTFAPDSMEEVLQGRHLLELWTAKAWYKAHRADETPGQEVLIRKGRELLNGREEDVEALDVFGEHIEKSKRNVRICKVYKAYHAYTDMIVHYAMMNLMTYLEAHPEETLTGIADRLDTIRKREWVNLGGQLVPRSDFDQICRDVIDGKLASWDDIHHRYDELWNVYPKEKMQHAYLALRDVLGTDRMTAADWQQALQQERTIQQFICDQVFLSRKKDYDNIFRKATYSNEAEMQAAIGSIEENSFIRQIRQETQENLKRIDALSQRIS